MGTGQGSKTADNLGIKTATNQPTKETIMTKKLLNTFSVTHVLQDGVSLLKVCKVYRDTDWQEYIVTTEIDGIKHPALTYHCTDKADAIGTAQVMVNR